MIAFDSKRSPSEILKETGLIKDPEKNLRSKIGSLLSSLKNLQEKQRRLDYEIRRQKKSLVRKQQELKRVSRSLTNRRQTILESSNLGQSDVILLMLREQRRLDSIAIEEINRLLDQD